MAHLPLRGGTGWRAVSAALLVLCAMCAGAPGRALAQTATTLAPVDDTVGVILGSDGRIYGALNDTTSGNGTVFSMNTDGSGFANLYTVDGGTLYGLVQGGDGRLYGLASEGGQAEVFALTSDGTTFSVLHTFPGAVTGGVPTQVPLIIGNDGRLYGTTAGITLSGIATVFAINTDGTGFTTLYTFQNDATAGGVDILGIIQGSDGRLYGTTLGGPSGSSGAVFALNTDGTGFTQLYTFGFLLSPLDGVIQGSDGRLYGVVFGSVGSTIGQFVYALNTDGTGYTTLCLVGTDSGQCETNLLQGRDGLLYGMVSAEPLLTAYGAAASTAEGQGCIFSVATDGSDCACICTAPPGYFNSGLVQDASGRLYGSCSTAVYSFLAPLSTSRAAPTTVSAGATLTLGGSPPATGYSYQWLYEGADIAGATGSQLVVPLIATSQAGYYTLLTTSPGGTQSASVTYVSVASNAWLVNLSARALVAPAQGGDDILIAGFVTSGAGAKQVLLRGVGPSLASLGVSSGLLADPQLTLYSGQSVLAGPLGGWAPSLSTLFAQLGAFPLLAGSADAATSISVSPGPYTVQLTSKSGHDGIGVVEIYDADNGAPANRLTNLSARGFVGTGANVLFGGFVIAGSTPKTVLVRGIGPGLMQYLYNSGEALWDPVLTVFDNSRNVVATNEGWGQPPSAGSSTVVAGLQPATNAVMVSAGAFQLSYTQDAAMVLTLPPGAYTAQVSSASGSTGIALIEVYEVP